MLSKLFNNLSQLDKRVDALLIIDKNGIVEYSIIYNSEIQGFVNEDYIGKHILEIYPDETEESSNHYRVMKSGTPILNETETVTDINGKSMTFLNSTFPLEHNNEILGTIETSIIVSTGKNISGGIENKNLFTLSDIITDDPVMIEVKTKIIKTANSNSPVMIWGDTGTGKELIAQAIHNNSDRRPEPFISLNCSSIPESLLEGLMFGTEKGSFTGAEKKRGFFELADNGTLFLDELNSMDIGLQSKLLKAIEDKKIRRVGGEKVIDVDIRVISALNTDPHIAVDAGKLRNDLYYRLGVIQIYLPPLKNRPGDIELLTEYFIDAYNKKLNKDINGFNEIVKDIFLDYPWPGNIRELKNAIEYAFNMADSQTIQLTDIPDYLILNRQSETDIGSDIINISPLPLNIQVEEFEKRIIYEALSNNKNVSQAAKYLGMSRQALQYKIEKYHLG